VKTRIQQRRDEQGKFDVIWVGELPLLSEGQTISIREAPRGYADSVVIDLHDREAVQVVWVE
jgi:hypothetical protein